MKCTGCSAPVGLLFSGVTSEVDPALYDILPTQEKDVAVHHYTAMPEMERGEGGKERKERQMPQHLDQRLPNQHSLQSMSKRYHQQSKRAHAVFSAVSILYAISNYVPNLQRYVPKLKSLRISITRQIHRRSLTERSEDDMSDTSASIVTAQRL